MSWSSMRLCWWPSLGRSPRVGSLSTEELEDLSELGAESWAGILAAHLDETILPGFYDRMPVLRINGVELVAPDW